MYSLTRNTTAREIASIEAPSFMVSLVVAQTLFKFGSFSLELVCFLALWWGISALLHKLTGHKR